MTTPYKKFDFSLVAKQKSMFKKARKPKPQRYFFFDIETFSRRQDDVVYMPFRLACSREVVLETDGDISYSHRMQYNTLNELRETIESKCKERGNLTVVAHNISFDISRTHMIEWLASRGWRVKTYYSQQSVTVIRMVKGRARLTFLDSMNLFNSSLEDISKSTPTNKGKVDFENISDEELFSYCAKDVDILVEIYSTFKKYLSENHGVNIGYTISSTSISIWRATQPARQVTSPKDSKCVRMELDSYYGGRVEACKLGKYQIRKFYKLDFNSLYPSVMVGGDFSVKHIGSKNNPTVQLVRDLSSHFNIVIDCDIFTVWNCYPVRTPDGIFFPVGKFRTTLAGDEAKVALAKHDVTQVHRVQWYATANLFENLVRDMYDTRMEYKTEGQDALAYSVKILMNGLYGKFAQLTSDIANVGHTKKMKFGSLYEMDDNLNLPKVLRVINHEIYEDIKNKITQNTSPVIAAEITAAARLELFRAAQKAGVANVYYMDTDSLIVNHAGYNNLAGLIDNYQLGKMKLEGTANNLEIRAPKNYIFGSDVVHKGIPKTAEQVAYERYKFLSFRTLHANLFSEGESEVGAEYKYRQLANLYWKGVKLPTGKVVPWTL